MIEQKYDIIYADPPWDYRGCFFDYRGYSVTPDGENGHYKTCNVEEIAKINLPSICPEHCAMFMWATSPLLPEALYLLHEWGFDYSTVAFVWYKRRHCGGNYTLSQCEICLLGIKGNGISPATKTERQFYSETRGEHSEKPIEIRKRIERMFPYQRKLEMFSRSLVFGWDVFGDETSHFDNSIQIDKRLMVSRFER